MVKEVSIQGDNKCDAVYDNNVICIQLLVIYI
jgi:hypothetical protein